MGTWENTDLGDGFAALNVVTGQLTTRLLEPPARRTAKTGRSQPQRWPAACAAPLGDIARAAPRRASSLGIITIDHAPWPRGAVVEQV